MRLPTIIVSICLVVLAAAGWFYVRAVPRTFDGPVGPRIEAVRAAFMRQRTPVAHVDWQTMAKAEELVDPALAQPFTETLPAAGMRQVYAYAETCAPPIPKTARLQNAALAKALAWARYQCGEAPTPGEEFFREPPFMHPSGASYARLAVESGALPFTHADWQQAHAGLFHVRELTRFPAALGTASVEAKLLAGLTRPALAAVVKGQPFIISDPYFLIFVRSEGESAAGGVYNAYPLAAWRAFASRLPFELKLRQPDVSCLYGTGLYCWTQTPAPSGRWLQGYAIAGFSALAVLALTLSLLLLQRIRSQRQVREDQLFVLRALTHELRTPATTLALALEEMRSDFDHLPEASQRAFLRICDEVGRLGRVIAGSSRYLKVGAARADERFAPATLPSLTAFCEAMLESYLADGQVRFSAPAQDTAFRIDPYWLRVCLVNLLENALQHGRSPVAVAVSCMDGWLELRVQDAGELADISLAQLTRAFLRRGDSGGLGLGLSIVQQTARDLGGSLTLIPSPTTFVLRLKESL